LGSQTVGGPVLIVPFRLANSDDPAASDELYLLPEQLDIASESKTKTVARGIYRIPIYEARIQISGRFPMPAVSKRNGDREYLWDQAVIALPISATRSIREPVRFVTGGASAALQFGGTRGGPFGPELVARYADLGLGAPSAPLEFSVDVAIGGSNWLGFLPSGRTTRVTATSDWPSPSFRGAYLPEERTVTDEGFTATWRVLDFGRAFPPR
jgi:inner membrane protein